MQYLEVPMYCPYCTKETVIKENNNVKTLWCTNKNCQGQLINRIEGFFSKKGLNAKGISKATIEKLIEWGWVNEIKDMFTLSKYAEEWKNKTGFGEKSVTNIITSIRESCDNDLESIISAAGIPLIGRTVARQISNIFNTYEDFRKAIKNFDFSKIDGFGYAINKALKDYNYTELDYIVNNFLNIKDNNNSNNSNNNNKLNNIIFCITGKLHNFKNRDELIKVIENNGGRYSSSISNKINYLINNDINSNSEKNKKAKNLNIKIITEEEFLKMIL